MNHGQAKVPGIDKSDKRCKKETIEKRIEIEIEVANLWEKITKKMSLYSVLLNNQKPSDELTLVRETLTCLLDLFNKTGKKVEGEFAKELSLVIGRWAESKGFVSDLSSMINHLQTNIPMGFGSVQLMTMRKAKGLEADVVLIAGLEDDLLPNPISDTSEEARLFYVSMTRAKEKLYLLHAYKRLRSISYGPEITGKERSRFLNAIGRKSTYMKD